MACGKTTLGEALSKRLNIDFVDLDVYVESTKKMSINRIFELYGEAEFRRIESEILDDLINEWKDKAVIVALGGGTPCRPGAMEKLNAAGLTVFLKSTIERIIERLMENPSNRPLVRDMTPGKLSEYVESKLSERMPWYEKACVSFDSSRLENEAEIAESVDKFIVMLSHNGRPSEIES